ncbi:hypothetical protein BDP27DRAFT_1424805 [Rhodocollybia butyracea]|uniref:F-box domain-containing protein n=1 Tax=Rhodocollybia butyracea TaxID=206335 RepID=A0A9P5PHK7_9AGAR|nr:hypothetical protein BDP27DRAFT_1424805 [Rhodocollybia butyracea]
MLAPLPSQQPTDHTSSSIIAPFNRIVQPNLATPLTARSALFIPELLTEIFKYLTLEDLRVYAAVCVHWEEPAQARLLETVRLDSITQMRYLRTKPAFRRYVRNLITSDNFDIPVHELLVPEWTSPPDSPTLQYNERPMNITSWQLAGPVSFPSSRFLINGLYSYSSTLQTFRVHDSLQLDLDDFCDLLNTLGQCQNLENLALPLNLHFLRYETYEQHISRCEEAFSTKLAPSSQRPRILGLQLVSTNRRYRLYATKPMNAVHTIWIPHINCPLSFADTSELIVGQGADLQRVLPVVSKLKSLEICCESPSLWTNYGDHLSPQALAPFCYYLVEQLLKAPLKLPFLKSLRMSFRQMNAMSSFLQIIDTPSISTVRIRYDWVWHPFHSSFFENNRLRDVLGEITKMGVKGSFPKFLKEIYIEGSWYTPQYSPLKPPGWLLELFEVEGMASNNVRLLLEPITPVEPIFMRAHDTF